MTDFYHELLNNIDSEHRKSMMSIRTVAANGSLSRVEREEILTRISVYLKDMVTEIEKMI